MPLKLATWNVASPVSARRRDAMRRHTDRERADVWVLTEAHDGFSPGHAYSHSSSRCRDGHDKPEQRWVTIWSRHKMEPLATSDEARTAAARVKPESGAPFVVFATVLPWLGSTWGIYPSAGGVAFSKALSVQLADWTRLQGDFADDEFFVLGDFNQDLVHPGYYGSKANRQALEAALRDSGLVALTAGEGDPIRRDSPPCACIDHICAKSDSKWQIESASRWPDVSTPERSLSDHFGLSIKFRHR
jgi:hypothetical protein